MRKPIQRAPIYGAANGCLLLEMDEHKTAGPNNGFAIGSGPAGVVLADQNTAVFVDMLNIHNMAVVACVADSDISDTWVAIYGVASTTSVVIPLVGISIATPVRHVTPRSSNFVSSVADAFAVIHAPAVYAVVEWIIATPYTPWARCGTRITAATSWTGARRAAK